MTGNQTKKRKREIKKGNIKYQLFRIKKKEKNKFLLHVQK